MRDVIRGIDWKTPQKKDNWLRNAILPSPFVLHAFWNETVMSSSAILDYEYAMRTEANTTDEGKER